MFVKKILNNQFILIICIFILSLSVRLYGLNWDQGQHLHPDERFLTMIDSTIKLPKSLLEYFNTQSSPLNPYNYKDYQFFVYGTFPLFLTKYIGDFLNLSDYNHIHLVGRVLSAIFDSLNIFSLFFLSLLIFKKTKKNIFVFLPSFIYALTVLPLQLSHFFAVDTFLCFFILLSFVLFSCWLVKDNYWFLISASISFGLAFSCKISAFLFLPIIILFFIYKFFKSKKILVLETFLFLIISFLTFRIFQPYSFVGLFKINPYFVDSLKYLQSILINKNVFYPPEIQWLNRIPLIYPLINIIFAGLGLPIFLIFVLTIKNLFKTKINFLKFFKNPINFVIFNAVIWILFLLVEQGVQFTSTMRYFLPIYTFICLLAGLIISSKILNPKIVFTLIIFHLLFCLLFLSIYTRPHSRVEASIWIYENLKSGSTITNEYWDDALPLYLKDFSSSYKNQMLPLYDPDNSEKWQNINSILQNTDYIFMTSNRLWGSIPRVSSRYPVTSKFYQNLFDEKLPFKKLMEFNSYPGISVPFMKNCYYFGPTIYPYLTKKNNWFQIDNNCKYPGLYLRDDIIEEAFTVYDHPKVLIFKHIK